MADGEAGATPQPKKSDLGVRTLSAMVMLTVTGALLWLGGLWWTLFAVTVGFGVIREWVKLVGGFIPSAPGRFGWAVAGAMYCGLAVTMLIGLRQAGIGDVLRIVGAVIATDIGAYFAGRTFGGPKIAPKISPSKTWAGLIGGILGASLVFAISQSGAGSNLPETIVASLMAGSLLAIVAQTGDFFESWMKRRADVKDSGQLIPGHGGLFDRVDGLLAVLFVMAIAMLATRGLG